MALAGLAFPLALITAVLVDCNWSGVAG
jgi:hypothetical protein